MTVNANSEFRPALTVEQSLQQAVALHQAGRLQEAEPLYRAVLQAWPKHPDANHNLGVLAMQLNQPEVAVSHLKIALDGNPAQGQYWLSYIAALIQAGQSDTARQVLAQGRQRGLQGPEVDTLAARLASLPSVGVGQGQAAAGPSAAQIGQMVALFNQGRYAELEPMVRELTVQFPEHGFGWQMLGVVLKQLGRAQEALAPLQRAAALLPGDAEAHHNLGLIAHSLNRLPEAEASYRRALELKPEYADAHNNLGACLKAQRRLTEAEASYRRALELKPDFAGVHANLGAVLLGQGRLSEAEASIRRALEFKPDYAEAHSNLGLVLIQQGRLAGAEASFRRAVELRPDNGKAHYNLGNNLRDQGRFREAESCYRRALELKPDDARAHNNLGTIFQAQGRLHEAEASYRRALEIQPDWAEAHSNVGAILTAQGRLSEAEASCRQALALKPDYEDAYGNLLFTLNYDPDRSAQEIFAAYRAYEERFGRPHRSAWRAHTNSREVGRRLKVGYVSPDFNGHSVRHFLEPLLGCHDKAVVEVYAYAEVKREDAVTARYKGYVEHWIPTRAMSDEALSERIRGDRIDILVDLAGHTTGNRLGVFARKPAPVSVSWLGYGYTTGLEAIDYFLSDEASAPAGSEELFSEAPWRVATPAYVYRPAEGMGEVNVLPALERGYVTFGTLTRAVRINQHSIRVWSQILKRLPGSRLVIDSGNFQEAGLQEGLAQRFVAQGIERGRLEIGYHSPPWDVLRGLDIGLDCFPHNSGTTLFETLYMGVPYVSLAGRPSVGRLGSSILQGAGHPEWIAASEQEYIDKAVELASDLGRLAEIRARLRAQMQAGPLMDEAGFARKLEAAYREMFDRWAKPGSREGERTQPEALQSQAAAGPSPAQVGQMMTLFNQGRYAELEPMALALTVQFPEHGSGWQMLGVVLKQLGRAQEALAPLQRAAELLPGDAEAHYNLGLVLKNLGRLIEAEASFRRALEIKPGLAEIHGNLGIALHEQGRLTEAEASFRRALEIKPDYVNGHKNLGTIFQMQGRLAEAEASFRRTLEIEPYYVDGHKNLGAIFQMQRRLPEAEASFRRVLEIEPDCAEIHCDLGATLLEQGQLTEAEISFRRALEIAPDYADAHSNLSLALVEQWRLREAEASCRRGLEIKPDFPEAYINMSAILTVQGRFSEAEACCRRVLELKPDFEDAFGSMLFALNYDPYRSAQEVRAVLQEYDERFGLPHRGAWRAHANSREVGRRLKVGYVSADFNAHSMRLFLEPLLERHDKAVVEVYAYAEIKREDAVTARYKGYVDHWVSTSAMSDEALCERIRGDGIDILVDLAGHTSGNRLGVFARKPAPVQVTYLGYPGSSGLSAMDYRLTDGYADPQGSEAYYTEKLLRLPGSLWCYRPEGYMPQVTELPARRNGYITFGSFNAYNKIADRCIELWAQLLQAVPHSRLLIVTVPEGEPRQRLAERFGSLGVSAERLEFQGRLSSVEFYRTIQRADIALDPITVNGATTTCECLWLGVPVLALVGKRFLQRAGWSILSAAGLPEFAATTAEEYLDLAAGLARDVDRLAQIRARLRAQMQAGPLMDEAGFARKLEAAYREMFEKWANEPAGR